MNRSKKNRLEAKGWKVGSTAEFLSLSPVEDTQTVEMLVLDNASRNRVKRNDTKKP